MSDVITDKAIAK